MLTKQEHTRYDRQLMIPEIGTSGQEKLKAAKVVVAGVGGIGSPVLLYLAAAGIGTLRIIDSDRVEVSNLNRQVLHTEKDIGREKVVSAAEKLQVLNPYIKVEPINAMITNETVSGLVGDYLIVDALDNLATRNLLNSAAIKRNLPYFHGAVHGFEGRATTIIPLRTACIGCLYKEALPGAPPVVGVTPAVIGSIQAAEVIKYITGIGETLQNRLLIYDGLGMKFNEVRLKRDPGCPACGAI